MSFIERLGLEGLPHCSLVHIGVLNGEVSYSGVELEGLPHCVAGVLNGEVSSIQGLN